MTHIKSVTCREADRLAFSLAELAAMIGVSRAFLRNEIERGHLRPRNLGRRIVITRDEVYRYLNADVSPSQQPRTTVKNVV